MLSGRVYFDLARKEHPRPKHLTFGFYFKPILPLLRPCYWLADYWPLVWPHSPEADAAVQEQIDGVTLPDTVLPAHAFEILGDRDEFFGFHGEPPPVEQFRDARVAAAAAPDPAWERMRVLQGKAYLAAYKQYAAHVAAHGTEFDRFLDATGVEFAFLTNDAVWWIAYRDPSVTDALTTYAAATPGMRFRKTVAFCGP